MTGLTALLLAKALAASNASQQPLPDGSTSSSSPSSPASPSSSASSSSSGAPVTPPAVLDIVPSQRSLAEISELIYAANVVHDGTLNCTTYVYSKNQVARTKRPYIFAVMYVIYTYIYARM